MSSLACRLCGQPIKFDGKHVSQRTGKKIPLHPTTNATSAATTTAGKGISHL